MTELPRVQASQHHHHRTKSERVDLMDAAQGNAGRLDRVVARRSHQDDLVGAAQPDLRGFRQVVAHVQQRQRVP